MSDLDTVIVTILGSSVVLFIGYVLNGWRERSFERRKTNYHSKLAAFKEINEAISGLMRVFLGLRDMFSAMKVSSESEVSVRETLVSMMLAKDMEARLGSTTCQTLIDEWDSIEDMQEGKQREEAVSKWLRRARTNLTLLHMRMLNYDIRLLNKAGADALLVASTPEVQDKLALLFVRIESELKDVPLSLTDFSETPAGFESIDMRRLEDELVSLINDLQVAMRYELSNTM